MSSTTKVALTRDGLRNMIDKAWADRIAAKEKEIEDAQNGDLLLQRIDAWRTTQHSRVKALANRIRSGKIQDAELIAFNIPTPPDASDNWSRRHDRRARDELVRDRDKAIARFEALKWPSSGEREFTEAQITNLFGA